MTVIFRYASRASGPSTEIAGRVSLDHRAANVVRARGIVTRGIPSPTQRISDPSAPAKQQRFDGLQSSRERAEEKRLAKLARVREEVESGRLVIRKMTEEERRRFPPVSPTRICRR
jgi:hypothetical protein